MRILFADAITEDRLTPLRDAGHDVLVDSSLRAGDLPDNIAGFDALVVRSTKVTAATIDAADRLALIVRAGAGTDNIDTDAASRRGMYVCNVPGRNAIAVAELTLGLLLAIDRHIADNVADLRDGLWDKKRYTKADGIYGKSIAIIGLGEIGFAVAERAKAFGMTVLAERKPRNDRAQARIRSTGIHLVDSLDELLSLADVVSLHTPKAPETIGMVDAEFLGKLKPGTILLNTARGDLVVEDDLIDALDHSQLRAGLDVYPDEPSAPEGDYNCRLGRHPSVVGTHHIGASTLQAQRAIAEGTVAVIADFASGNAVNCVNLTEEALGSCLLTVRHLDKVGVLAKVFAELRSAGCSIQQMQNQVFQGAFAAVANINVEGNIADDVLERIESDDDIIAASISH
ncbi:MAG: hydroxyacid dehydrogenase [Actinomycetia bacterium]|nr:hydroxyacid dehydrogenase [Actinomycetes bacterium]MCP4961044.1 hydroxyacid dehydrogenase [Actinomycetes bacterium]